MILLDTNVVSELMRKSPEPAVVAWVRKQPAAGLFLCALTEAELRYGAALLPAGKRRTSLEADIEEALGRDFAGRILPFDSLAAGFYATIAAGRRKAGRPINSVDCQIAAIARSRGAALATRDVSDFTDCGVATINPWTGRS